MAFKDTGITKIIPDTPEALLQDIRTKKINGPIAHQADMWRRYQELALNKSDVAFQLPTGSGKTLVGIVLAEWRRVKFNEKVVYLCPTKQLVNQVAKLAKEKYKINVTEFTGPKSEFSSKDKLSYQEGECVAITTYSALFNTNPFFDNPDIVILDDAHASENYISSFWSLNIDRFDKELGGADLYEKFANLIKHKLSASDEKRMIGSSDDMDFEWSDKLSTSEFNELHETIYSLLNHNCKEGSLYFQWKMIQDNLNACHCYLSSSSILIRPLIAPTFTHAPFCNAKQRIYMSATLGASGDLERITGRKNIYRLPIPDGWDKQGIGRRFFVFPERSLEKDAVEPFVDKIITKAGRSVYLMTDDTSVETKSQHIEEELLFDVFNAIDIEETKEAFTSEEKAVAVLSNRYDGIDFPEDESHMLIIDGLPTATNLQERFFVTRMAATALLHERVMTRLLQAMGRCTRSPNDFSVVVVLGEQLVTHMISKKNRSMLHPELQAELNFGFNQSKDMDEDGLLENIDAFLGQTDDWIEADKVIVADRSSCIQENFEYIDNLKNAVVNEIKYNEKLWQGDYIGAANEAKNIFSILTHRELKGYRALWSYLIGSAYELAGGTYKTQAIEPYKRAMNLAPSLKWLVELARKNENLVESITVESSLSHIFEKFESNILHFGMTNHKKYTSEEKFIIDNLQSKDGKKFEEAQTRLGNLIGYTAYNEESQGAPDPIWFLQDNKCIVFEDYTEADETQTLSITKARQADSHSKWIKEFMNVPDDIEIIKVLVTDAQNADSTAIAYLKDVYLWKRTDFVHWAMSILSILRELREEFDQPSSLFWREKVIAAYSKIKLSPDELTKQVKISSAYSFYK